MQAEAMDGINMLCWWVIHVIRSVPTDAMESLREGSLWRGGMGGETRWAVRARERSARNLLRGIWHFSRQTSHTLLVRRFESEGFAACAAAAREG